jgi:predicted GIY-YIG superfamily endonuclease
MVGIYKITNPKGQTYIGLSKDIEKRFQSHKNLQFKGNIKLRESLIEYGENSHLFEVLEEVNISTLERSQANNLLQIRERYWINYFKTFEDGLNANRGGSGCGSHTEESKRKISEANSKPKPANFGTNRKKWQHTEEFKEKVRNSKRRPILMYDKEGNLVGEFPNNVKAAEYIGCQKSAIWNVLNGYKSSKALTTTTHVKGYTFKYL